MIFEKKYFYQQKIYAIKIIFLTVRVGGIFSSGSLPSEALSSHVLASSGCWGSCQFLLVPKHQFVPCTLSLLPQRSFWQHLHCDLASEQFWRPGPGAFPSEALSEVTCCRSLSHPTAKCCTCDCFAVSDKDFSNIFMIIKEPLFVVQEGCLPSPWAPASAKVPSRDSCLLILSQEIRNVCSAQLPEAEEGKRW